jgi:Amt family ammonium transporter
MTFVILKVLGLVVALRPDTRTEGLGMDVTQHGEEAYTSGEGSILVLPSDSPERSRAGALSPQTAR